MVYGPILVMLAAGVGLVATRIWLGRGAALGAVAFFLLVRGVVSVIVGPVFGQTTPHFALFIVEALAVETVFLALPRARPLTLGLWSGLAIGTFGLAAEWAWTNVWMPIPWNADLLPEGAVLGLLAAVAGSLVGAWVGERLALRRAAPPPRHPLRRGRRRARDLRDRRLRAREARAGGRHRPRSTLADAGPGQAVPTVRISPPERGRGRRVHQRHRLAGRRPRARAARADRRARRRTRPPTRSR